MNHYERNLQRIEKALDENMELLSEYDRQLSLVIDPRERERLKNEITFCKQRNEELEKDLEEADAKLRAYQDKIATQILITPFHTERPLDKQLSEVVELFLQGRVVPVLGAGINQTDRPPGSSWKPGQFPPSSEEIAVYLAKEFEYPASERLELPRVCQHAAINHSPGRLYEHLLPMLRQDYPSSSVHRFFAKLPRLLRQQTNPVYPLIITTNYDNLLEQAFDQEHEAYDLLVYSAGNVRSHFTHLPFGATRWLPIYDPTSYIQVKPEIRPIILKVHGVLDRLNSGQDNLIVTEDDFINYMSHFDISNLLPNNLLANLQRHSLLFLGYHLTDWNLRVVLHRLWEQRRNPYDSWAIEPDLQSLAINFWQKMGVKVFSSDLKDYMLELYARLNERTALKGKEPAAL